MKIILIGFFMAAFAVFCNASAIGRNEVAVRESDDNNEVDSVSVDAGATTKILGIMRANLNYRTCLFNVMTSDVDYESATTAIEIYKVLCKATQKEAFMQCQRDLRNNLRPYLVDQMEPVEIALNVSSAIISFGCDDDAKNLEDFEKSGGVECLNNNRNQIESCIEGVIGVNKYASASDIALGVSRKVTSKTEGCTKLGDLRKCVVRSMRYCRPTTSANIINSLMLRVESTIGCQLPTYVN